MPPAKRHTKQPPTHLSSPRKRQPQSRNPVLPKAPKQALGPFPRATRRSSKAKAVHGGDDGVPEDHQDETRRRKIARMNVPPSSSESNLASKADHVGQSQESTHDEDDAQYLPSEEAEEIEWEDQSEVEDGDRRRAEKGGRSKREEVAAGSTPNTQTTQEVAEEIANHVNAPSERKRRKKEILDLDHYMEDFEAIYAEAEEECKSLMAGKMGPTAKAATIEAALEGIEQALKREETNLQAYLQGWNKMARDTMNQLKAPFEAFVDVHKQFDQGIKQAARHYGTRPTTLRAVRVELETDQRGALGEIQDKTKVALDAKDLIKATRRLIRSARG